MCEETKKRKEEEPRRKPQERRKQRGGQRGGSVPIFTRIGTGSAFLEIHLIYPPYVEVLVFANL